MKFPIFIGGIFSALLVFTGFGISNLQAAEDYPNRTVTIIVPFPPGGGTDTMARPVAEALSKELGQSFVVENIPGANGIIGTVKAANAEPDGYTLYVGDFSTIATTPNIEKNVRYSPLDSFDPVTQFIRTSTVLVVHPDSPIQSLSELIATAKKEPGKLNFGTSSTSTLLPMLLLSQMADIKLTHIPYKGTGQVLNDMLAGHIDLMFGGALGTMPFVKEGKLRALAVAGKNRIKSLPDIPTVAEQGYEGYDVSSWNGLMVPAGTPREIVDKINAVVVKALQSEPLKSRLEAGGVEVVANSPEEFDAVMAHDYAKWRKIIKDAGIQGSQ